MPRSLPLDLKPALLLGLISFIVYANTLKNSYAFDDIGLIKKNTLVTKGVSAIPEILLTPYHHGSRITTNDQYRPLSLVMFAVEFQVWGMSPATGHFFNVLLFAGCVILLFLFFERFFERKKNCCGIYRLFIIRAAPNSYRSGCQYQKP